MIAPGSWEPPVLPSESFAWKVGTSVLTEFVRGHGYTDLLRELVQNEYDAGGRRMVVRFGDREVTVHGSGSRIDSAGWRRLAVMLGTGAVAGSSGEVQPKANGIGSKNFGLRSLFLIGDQIWVRSGGRMTVMDPTRGALAEPLPDSATAGVPGVIIHVPYRTEAHERLPAFTIEQEQQALDRFRGEAATTLLKLARPGREQSLNEVIVESERLHRQLSWRQNAKARRVRGKIQVIDRVVRFEAREETVPSSRALTREAEYQTVVGPPSGLSFPAMPAYFRERSGRVTIGLSVRLAGRNADPNDTGGIYYPLLASAGMTGCAVSLNAPFEMDADRSRPLGADQSDWNEWLLEAAAEFALELLPAEWLDRFGGNAYSALLPADTATAWSLAARVSTRVKLGRVWPSAEPPRRGRHLLYEAKSLATPSRPILGQFLGREQVLSPALAQRPKAAEYARQSGSRAFTVNSLLRLRSRGQAETPPCYTKVPDGEADYYYRKFPAELLDVDLQRRYGKALDDLRLAHETHLRDLKESPTTLAASGELAPGASLWAVPAELMPGAPIPMSQQLHPALLASRVLARRVARTFSVADWARTAADRAASGHASADEVAALASFIRTAPRLPVQVWAKVRSAPIIQDTEARWVKPAEALLATAHVPAALQRAFHVAAPAYTKDKRLVQALRLRSRLSTADLVAAAEHVATEASLAPAYEQLLKRNARLIHRGVAARLHSIAFLQTSEGTLDAPERLYMPTANNRAVLGDSVNYVGGRESALYLRLGCRDRPSSGAIVARLRQLREAEVTIAGEDWDRTYGQLVAALDRERSAKSTYREEAIVCLNGVWCRPVDVLVGAQHITFMDLVPVVRGARGDLLRLLGAANKPQPAHWRTFFVGVAERRRGTGVLSREERIAVGRAAASLDEIPEEIADLAILLDRSGRLHKLTAARAGRLLLDDDPKVAAAAIAAGIPIDFVDDSESDSLRFYEAAGVRRLTAVYKRGPTVVHEERRPPEWLPALLKAVQSPVLGPAIERLMEYQQMRRLAKGTLARRLTQVRGIQVAAKITCAFRIVGRQMQVDVPWAMTDSGIAIAGANRKNEGLNRIAAAVATLATNELNDQRRLVDAIYRLLECRSAAEVSDYLESHGIRWQPRHWEADEADSDDESNTDEELRKLFGDLLGEPGQPAATGPSTDGGAKDDEPPETAAPEPHDEPPLPPLSTVNLELLPMGSWIPPKRKPGRGGGGGGGHVRDPEEEERDRELGRRGEELIYLMERDRLLSAGLPPERAAWVSRTNETADHDILSVHEDGKPLYIEVKTTAGTHGRFVWPRAEFERARTERDHCVLWRVYEGRSQSPKARAFPDPVNLILANHVRIDLDTLSAEVEPL